MKLIEWLTEPSFVSRAERLICSAKAYYWTGGVSDGAAVGNISLTGAFLCIPERERWCVGTIMIITLQSLPDPGSPGGHASYALTVPCRIVRHTADGLGVEFLFVNSRQSDIVREFLNRTAKPPQETMLERQAG